MLLTHEKFYFVTSVAKGLHIVRMMLTTAKHLEALISKDGVPMEILKRSKDEELSRKPFRDVIDVMKTAGVCT